MAAQDRAADGISIMRNKAPAPASQTTQTSGTSKGWRILSAMIAAAAAGLSTAGV